MNTLLHIRDVSDSRVPAGCIHHICKPNPVRQEDRAAWWRTVGCAGQHGRNLKHYLAQHRELANNAIAKLVTWYEGQEKGDKA